MSDPRATSELMPFRCLRALDKIESLLAHARTDVIDLVEMIQDACDEALHPAIADRNPTGGDVKQAPSRSDESGGAEGNRTTSVLLHKRSD